MNTTQDTEMNNSQVLYPDITVELTDGDGNAFYIIGKVRSALRRNGVDTKQIQLFTEEATMGDYEDVVRACMRWVNVL